MSSNLQNAYRADEVRANFGKDNLTPLDVFGLARTIPRLSTMLYPLGDNISGMCVKHEHFSLIVVNAQQTYGRQRFTLAHELYHLLCDEQNNTIICPKNSGHFDESERSADTFASYLLLPYNALRNEIKAISTSGTLRHLSGDNLFRSILEIEQKYEISRHALLVRLSEEKAITTEQKEQLLTNVKHHAHRLGFSLALYQQRQGSDAKKVDGEYLDLICLLLAEEKISQGKAQELLNDGFRDDIAIETFEGDELVD